MEPTIYLKVAIEAAKAAEPVILKYFSKETQIDLKPDQSPVTFADKEAERIIRETIMKAFPDHGFLGEESDKNASLSEYIWIVDPIDGTRNYIREIPLFATEIALMKDGELILGVSNAPAIKELMYAEKGFGAYLNGEKIVVSEVSKLEEAYFSHGGMKHFDKHHLLGKLLSLGKQVRLQRGIGDFWSYHLLAQGKIDIMIEAEMKIWDIAALTVIVQEAGGVVTDIEGKAISLGSTSNIATNKHLFEIIKNHFLS